MAHQQPLQTKVSPTKQMSNTQQSSITSKQTSSLQSAGRAATSQGQLKSASQQRGVAQARQLDSTSHNNQTKITVRTLMRSIEQLSMQSAGSFCTKAANKNKQQAQQIRAAQSTTAQTMEFHPYDNITKTEDHKQQQTKLIQHHQDPEQPLSKNIKSHTSRFNQQKKLRQKHQGSNNKSQHLKQIVQQQVRRSPIALTQQLHTTTNRKKHKQQLSIHASSTKQQHNNHKTIWYHNSDQAISNRQHSKEGLANTPERIIRYKTPQHKIIKQKHKRISQRTSYQPISCI